MGLKIKVTPRVFLPILVLIILGFLLYFYKGLFLAATVNGQPIWRLTLIRELEKQAGKNALDSLITRTLILQEANKQKITVSSKEIDQAVKQIEESLSKQGQNLDQLLAAQGMSRTKLNEQIKLQKMVEKIVGQDVSVTDKEVDEYIEKNKDLIPKDAKPDVVKEDAKRQLQQQKISEKANTWIESLRTNAQINYFIQF